jgi:DNA-binding XRE family transcriptional regulator
MEKSIWVDATHWKCKLFFERGYGMWNIVRAGGSVCEVFRTNAEARKAIKDDYPDCTIQKVGNCKLQSLRMSAKLSQKELAEYSGVSLKNIQAFESGARDISKAQLIQAVKLAEALGCQAEELLDE